MPGTRASTDGSKRPSVLKRKHFRAPIPAGAVLVARPSKWSSPFRLENEADRSDVIQRYRGYILDKLRSGALDIEELRGKDLVCYCAPKPCHGDVLLEFANMPKAEREARFGF